MKRKLLVLFIASFGALVISACSGVNVSVQDGNVVVKVDVDITEDQLNLAGGAAISLDNQDLIENATVDITASGLIVTGTVRCPDGSTQNGSITLAMRAANGQLAVEPTNATASCLALNPERLQQIGAQILEGLSGIGADAAESGSQITFNELTMTEDTIMLNMDVRAPIGN